MRMKFSKKAIGILLALAMVMPNLSGMFVYAENSYPQNLVNGDFESETLEGWNLIANSPEENVTKTLGTDEGGQYLQFNSTTNWKGIESEPFAISNLKNGDKVFVAYDWSGDTNFRVDVVSVSGVDSYSSEGNTNAKDRLSEKRTDWKSSFSQQSKVIAGIQEGVDAVFKIQIKERDNANSDPTLIDDVAVYVIRDDAYYDLAGNQVTAKLAPYYGDNERGIYGTARTKNERVMDRTPLDTNGDNPLSLVCGLKYWGPTYERTGYASDYATVREGVLTVNGTAAYDGVECVRITLPQEAQGRRISYSFQYMNTTEYAGAIKLRSWNGTGTNKDYTQNLSKNVAQWTTIEKKDITLEAGMTEVSLLIQNQAQGASLQIKDIQIYYENLEGEYVNIFAPPEPEDVSVGTKDGILTSEANGIFVIEATNGFINGEFTYDLKYWGTAFANTRPSAYAEIKTNQDGVNKYITLSGTTGQGIVSRSFTLPELLPYDKVGVIFDYKGNLDNVTVDFRSVDGTAEATGDGSNRAAYLASGEGWNTAIVDQVLSVKEAGTVYTLAFNLANSEASIDIDNIRLVRVAADGSYTSLQGGSIQYTDDGSVVLLDEVNEGTFSDGIITGEKNKINQLARTEQMMNGNFEKGLMYWGTRSGESPNAYATLKKESDGNTYVTFKGANYQDITMRRFIVAGLESGDKVALMGNFRGSSKSLAFVLECVNANSTNTGNSLTEVFVDKDSSKWSAAVSKTLTLGTISDENKTKYGTEEYIFQMRAESSSAEGSPISVDLDNFKVVKVKADGTYTELDGTPIEFKNPDGSIYNPLVGTYNEGIVTGVKYGIQQLVPSDKMYNGDFEQGLMYWGTRSGESPNVYAAIKKENNGNTYITFKGANYENIAMRRFIVDGLKAGDKVAVMGDFKGSSKSLSFALEVVNAEGIASGSNLTELFISKESGKWNTGASRTLTLGTISEENKTKYGTDGYIFQLRVESSSAEGSPISVDLDNFKVVKVKADGTYTELDGTPIVFKNPDGSIYNPLVGTYAEGIVTGVKYGIQQLMPSDKMYNGDFEQGLMYWGTRSGESPNVYATIKKENNGNTYITFKGANYENIAMRRFIVNGLKAGEQIALMGDYRGEAKGLNFVFECVNSEGSGNSKIDLYTTTQKNAWNTAVSKSAALGTISEANIQKYGTSGYIFQIRVESSSKEGSPISVDVDNLRLVKLLTDGSYTELDGTPIIFRNPDGSIYNPAAGTYDEGIITGTNYGINLLPPTAGFQNGDFEQGFTWWATVEGCSPKEYATIKKENGNTYINLHSSEWKGIVQGKFYFDGLEEGDQLAVMANYRGDTAFQLALNAWNMVEGDKNRAVGSTILYEPTQEGEWGIAVSRTNFVMTEIDKTLIEKYGERLLLRLMVQPLDGEMSTDFDNVRIVRVNADGTYSELDGTLIMLPESEEGESTTDALLDWNWGEEDETSDSVNEKGNVKNIIVISCIVVGIITVIAAGVLVFLSLKKKKKTENIAK